MLKKEAKGWGDTACALKRPGRRYGLSYWTLNNLRIGRAKTLYASLYSRIRWERRISRFKEGEQ